MCCNNTTRWIGVPDHDKKGDQQQVFDTVVQDDRVPVPFQIRKLNTPPAISQAADNLAVNEIADRPTPII